ncbi:hypothetical protein N643_01945 [Salmonella bongori serovar 48:z41:-- str. RKS3044]|nr:hypothetical protein N643_01945 [Salmonella bongori serovar 48:z41:-- str. RKS3044]
MYERFRMDFAKDVPKMEWQENAQLAGRDDIDRPRHQSRKT